MQQVGSSNILEYLKYYHVFVFCFSSCNSAVSKENFSPYGAVMYFQQFYYSSGKPLATMYNEDLDCKVFIVSCFPLKLVLSPRATNGCAKSCNSDSTGDKSLASELLSPACQATASI